MTPVKLRSCPPAAVERSFWLDALSAIFSR
jgi:hypothetical protein